MHIDHVILGTSDLDRAADRLLTKFGLASAPGGTHPSWGTGNRIVPLGSSYVEILGVVDAERATQSFVGTHLQQQVADGDRLIGWCLKAEDLDGTAARLGLNVSSGSRALPDGQILRWRSAGIEEAMTSRYLPFFISWDIPSELHPARMQTDHPVEPREIAAVAVGGDVTQLSKWLGGRLPPTVRAIGGPPAIHSVVITSGSGSDVVQSITLPR